jgi:hypothetical protein
LWRRTSQVPHHWRTCTCSRVPNANRNRVPCRFLPRRSPSPSPSPSPLSLAAVHKTLATVETFRAAFTGLLADKTTTQSCQTALEATSATALLWSRRLRLVLHRALRRIVGARWRPLWPLWPLGHGAWVRLRRRRRYQQVCRERASRSSSLTGWGCCG